MPLVKVKEKFQVTIPTEVRKAIHLEVGDILEVAVQGKAVILKPKTVVDRESVEASIAEGLLDYHEGRVPEYWAVDPEYSILYQHNLPKALRGGHYSIKTYKEGKLASKIIAGFWVEVSWLWQEILPRELSCLEEILAK